MQVTPQDVLLVVDVHSDKHSMRSRWSVHRLRPAPQRQRYGRTFLASLPPYRMTATITDVEAFFAT